MGLHGYGHVSAEAFDEGKGQGDLLLRTSGDVLFFGFLFLRAFWGLLFYLVFGFLKQI